MPIKCACTIINIEKIAAKKAEDKKYLRNEENFGMKNVMHR